MTKYLDVVRKIVIYHGWIDITPNIQYPSGRSSAQPKIKKWTDWRSLQEPDFYTVSLLTLNCLYFTNTERKKLGNAFNGKNA